MTGLAPRFRWAMATLPVGPADTLLEIGCGHGIALSLVAERLAAGRVLGIDRSARMTAMAAERNAGAIRDGRVAVRTGTLADVDLSPGGFDTAFAINVSLFMRPAERELARLRAALRPGGRLFLFYEAPGESASRAFLVEARRQLEANWLAVIEGPDQRVGACLIATVGG